MTRHDWVGGSSGARELLGVATEGNRILSILSEPS